MNSKWFLISVCLIILSVTQPGLFLFAQGVYDYNKGVYDYSKGVFDNLLDDSEDNKTSTNGFNEEICGLSNPSRIVGGSEAQEGQYPWLAGITNPGRKAPFCGSAIINKQFILTAAHCIEDEEEKDVLIVLGAHRFTDNGTIPPAKHFKVEKWAIHSDYNSGSGDNDIALIKITDKIEYSDRIRPICVPIVDKTSNDSIGTTATVAGWGRVEWMGIQSNVLKHVEVSIWPRIKCKSAYDNFHQKLNNNTVCAGNLNKDACQGDSGGPLMVKNSDKRWEIIGVVSWGNKCALAEYPTVYTRVSNFMDWIETQMKKLQ